MSIAAIVIAAIAAFLVFRFVSGLVKFALLALIVLAAIYFLSGGFGA